MATCTPAWTRGGCTPIIIVEDQGGCGGQSGGAKTVGSPVFVATVENEPDLIWRDEDYTVIQSSADGTPFWFDNI